MGINLNPRLTETEVPISDALVRTATAPFLDSDKFCVRRVRSYDLLFGMHARISRNVIKQFVLDRTCLPPHPSAVWSAIDVPFDPIPEVLVLCVGWHISPFEAFSIGVGAIVEFEHISCLLLTFTNASTFESDAWIIQRKSKWYRLKSWLLGGASVLAVVLMLSNIASLFVEGVETNEVIGVVGAFIAWLGFSYLYLTRR